MVPAIELPQGDHNVDTPASHASSTSAAPTVTDAVDGATAVAAAAAAALTAAAPTLRKSLVAGAGTPIVHPLSAARACS